MKNFIVVAPEEGSLEPRFFRLQAETSAIARAYVGAVWAHDDENDFGDTSIAYGLIELPGDPIHDDVVTLWRNEDSDLHVTPWSSLEWFSGAGLFDNDAAGRPIGMDDLKDRSDDPSPPVDVSGIVDDPDTKQDIAEDSSTAVSGLRGSKTLP